MKCALLSANRTWLPDGNGKPLAGHFLRFFDMETSNPAEVYSGPGDEIWEGTQPLGTEVQLDASGYAPMSGVWLDISKKYRMEVAKFIREDPVTGERFYQKLWDIGWLPSITDNTEFIVSGGGTISDLGKNPEEEFALVSLSGYYRPGDGGGGMFYWDADSTDNADGGMAFAPNPETAGRWKRILQGRTLRSAFYGAHAHADPNSGWSADVHDRWNAMMDFAKENDLTVYADGADGRDADGNPFAMRFLFTEIDFGAPAVLDPQAVFSDYAPSDADGNITINDENIHFADSEHKVNFGAREIKSSWFSPSVDLAFLLDCVSDDGRIVINSALEPLSADLGIRCHIILRHAPLNGNGKTLTFWYIKPTLDKHGIENAKIRYIPDGSAATIKVSDWMRPDEDGFVEITDDSFDFPTAKTLVCDMRCRIRISQPKLTLVAYARCDFAGDSVLYDAKAEGGALLNLARDVSIALHRASGLVIDGTMWNSASNGLDRVSAPNARVLTYTGNVPTRSFSHAGAIVFERCRLDVLLDFERSKDVTIRDSVFEEFGSHSGTIFNLIHGSAGLCVAMDNVDVAVGNAGELRMTHRPGDGKLIMRRVRAPGMDIRVEAAMQEDEYSSPFVVDDCRFRDFTCAIPAGHAANEAGYYDKFKITNSRFSRLTLRRYNTIYRDVIVTSNKVDYFTDGDESWALEPGSRLSVWDNENFNGGFPSTAREFKDLNTNNSDGYAGFYVGKLIYGKLNVAAYADKMYRSIEFDDGYVLISAGTRIAITGEVFGSREDGHRLFVASVYVASGTGYAALSITEGTGSNRVKGLGMGGRIFFVAKSREW